jgi:hypothetical protein
MLLCPIKNDSFFNGIKYVEIKILLANLNTVLSLSFNIRLLVS